MTNEKYYLTEEGYANLRKEYQRLKLHDKPLALKRIKNAREMDELEDNQEYEAAREAYSVLEGRLLEIEDILKNAQIIEKAVAQGRIDIGSKVTVEVNNQQQTFTIVGSIEADPSQGKVSHESPVGKSLLGLREGDIVEVKLPHATLEYRILKIHK